jgi:hypothetical protein
VAAVKTVPFQNTKFCDNDEARSVLVHDLRAGQVLTLYDSPALSRGDDWTEIVAKRDVGQKIVASLQTPWMTRAVHKAHRRRTETPGADGCCRDACAASTPHRRRVDTG